jgi:hypothetical protein
MARVPEEGTLEIGVVPAVVPTGRDAVEEVLFPKAVPVAIRGGAGLGDGFVEAGRVAAGVADAAGEGTGVGRVTEEEATGGRGVAEEGVGEAIGAVFAGAFSWGEALL